MAEFKVEAIGASFNDKDISTFTSRLNQQAQGGWELHTVFSVEKRGCMGSSEGRTYLAVYRKD